MCAHLLRERSSILRETKIRIETLGEQLEDGSKPGVVRGPVRERLHGLKKGIKNTFRSNEHKQDLQDLEARVSKAIRRFQARRFPLLGVSLS